MPMTPHVEKRSTATEAARDMVIGMSDGLAAAIALAAGLSAAVAKGEVIRVSSLSSFTTARLVRLNSPRAVPAWTR